MGGLLIIGLLIIVIIKLWPFLLGSLAAFLFWRLVVAPIRATQAREALDRLRHERARREIDWIAAETIRAMHTAAVRGGDGVIESTAVEVSES
jgi:hypothetical protein